MARYISKAQAFKRIVRHARHHNLNTAQGVIQVESEPSIIADFEQGGATRHEIDIALERFSFKGRGRENPARRLSMFDTDEAARAGNWSPELKDQVEANLDAGQGDVYFRVEAPSVAKPWP